jgi:assimilatory nitrate reductase catalytic subunit
LISRTSKKLHALLGLGKHSSADEQRGASSPLEGGQSHSLVQLRAGRDDEAPERWTKTTCGYCSVGCGMLIGTRGERVVAVRGDETHPVNEGRLCEKGLSEPRTLQIDGRAMAPLERTTDDNGESALRRVSWERALDRFTGSVRDIQDRYGRDAFAVLSTGQLVTEEFYTLGKLVQLGLRTPNYDGSTALCMATAVAGYKRSFGSDGPPGCYDDLELAECVVLIGANIAENHPMLAYRLFRDRSRKRTVIAIDPRQTPTAQLSDLHLSLRPRSDIALLNGLAHIIIREGWVKHAYVQQHTRGYDELVHHLRRFDPDTVSAATGIKVEVLIAAARAIGTARTTFFAWTMGVNHSTQGTETVNAINNLALLTGNVGVPGGSPFSITGQCNAMGTRESGFATGLPGYRKFDDDTDRSELATLWGVDASLIPSRRGLAYADIIQAIIEGRIRGLWVIATNPLVSFPNQHKLREALSRLELLVVQDGCHPTPTSQIAHVVLPSALWGEKEGTFTSSERRVSKVNPAVKPPGEARTDFDIFMAIAQRLGVKERLFPGWASPRDAFDEWRAVSAGRLCDYSGMTYALLEEQPLQWPYPASTQRGGIDTATPWSTPPIASRLYTDGRFNTEDGRAQLHCVAGHAPPEETNDEYPFLLNTGRTMDHWQTRTRLGMHAVLERRKPQAWVEVHPIDARGLQLHNDDVVALVSRRGRVEEIRVRITSVVSPGQLFVPFHFFEANVNALTLDAVDPISREPNFKHTAVRIEPKGIRKGRC